NHRSLRAAVAVVCAWLFEALLAKNLVTARDSVIASLVLLAIAVVAAIWSHLGRRTVIAAAVASVLFVFAIGQEGPMAAGIGIICAMFEILAAVLPWAAFLWASRGDASPNQGAAIAATGALAGQALLHLACKIPHSEPHLLAFHFGGVLLACMLG